MAQKDMIIFESLQAHKMLQTIYLLQNRITKTVMKKIKQKNT